MVKNDGVFLSETEHSQNEYRTELGEFPDLCSTFKQDSSNKNHRWNNNE